VKEQKKFVVKRKLSSQSDQIDQSTVKGYDPLGRANLLCLSMYSRAEAP
jgi:hypothetical protein